MRDSSSSGGHWCEAARFCVLVGGLQSKRAELEAVRRRYGGVAHSVAAGGGDYGVAFAVGHEPERNRTAGLRRKFRQILGVVAKNAVPFGAVDIGYLQKQAGWHRALVNVLHDGRDLVPRLLSSCFPGMPVRADEGKHDSQRRHEHEGGVESD